MLWIAKLFGKLHARYGRTWSSQWSTDELQRMAHAEWSARLAGLTGEDIKRGLDTYRGEWPPTVEQFRNACLQTQDADYEHRRMYQRFPKALPKPKANPEIVRRELAKMREALP